MTPKVIIVGSGLSGLTLAYLLSKKHIESTILEASPRIGGRIQTHKGELGTPLELGATWFSDMHFNLMNLINQLGLEIFPQFSDGISFFQTKTFEPAQKFYMPKTDSPSYRLAGGTQNLVDTLAEKISSKAIKLNTKVVAIKDLDTRLMIETSTGENLTADKVILCLPPQLIHSEIVFSPKLPDDLYDLLPTVQTWMAGSIKFILEYEKPFWRENGYSGVLYSHSGIVVEMYDHTNFENNKFGLTGFLNGSFSSYSKNERKKLVINQLIEVLGKAISNPIFYDDKIWTDEFTLGKNHIVERRHQNNGHPLLQKQYMSGKLYLSGTETSQEFSGYMEGAVLSAFKIADDF